MPMRLGVLTTALTGAGAAVSTAAAGAGAIEQWTRAPADVLICDLAMPDMGACERPRHRRAYRRRTKLINAHQEI